MGDGKSGRRVEGERAGPPVLASILFWLALFASAGLFAAVVLSPKWVAVVLLEERLRELEGRRSQVERRNEFLERVGNALAGDREFAGEVARYELGALETGEQRVAVPPVVPGTREATEAAGLPSAWVDGRWLPWAERLVEDRLASQLCLVLAGGLALVAFTFFNPIGRTRENGRRGRLRAATARASV